MLASQFLSVVIGEDKPSTTPCSESGSSESGSAEEDLSNNNIYQDLEMVCKLPQVLLSECTIRLCTPEEKKQRKPLRFEANVTPIFEGPPKKKPRLPSNNNIEDLLQGVEAVYSGDEKEEDDNESGESGPGSRSSKCGVCGRSFYRNCSLALHLKSHCSGPPPESSIHGYKCHVCGKTYSQRSVLKKHAAVHTGYRLRCKVCGIDFTQRSSLLRHCKRIHGIKNDSDQEILSNGLTILEDALP